MEPTEVEERLASRPYPRVTQESIRDKIRNTEYLFSRSHTGLTICILTLSNGFFVIGKSAPADPRNHDPELGKHYAYEDAFKQIWPLEGYLLKERLALTSDDPPATDPTA